mgnify:CR=1 FL=1
MAYTQDETGGQTVDVIKNVEITRIKDAGALGDDDLMTECECIAEDIDYDV